MKVAVLDINGKDTGRKAELSKAVFGIEPNNAEAGANKYSSFECKKFDGKPTFISNISAKDTNNKVNALKVNTCSHSKE